MDSKSVSLVPPQALVSNQERAKIRMEAIEVLSLRLPTLGSKIVDALPMDSLSLRSRTEDDERLLHRAVAEGTYEQVRMLLHKNVDVNSVEPVKKSTPLHLAVKHKRPRMIQLLLKNGANVRAKNKDGWTPMHMISYHDLRVEKSLAKERLTIYKRIASSLLEFGSALDATDNFGRTPLHLAIRQGNSIAVSVLLQLGSDINVEDDRGKTPVSYLPPRNQNSISLKLYDHIYRMRRTDQFVNEKIKTPTIKSMSQCRKMDESIRLQKEEIGKMRSTWLDDHTSLYDFLSKGTKELEICMENDRFKRLVTSPNFDNEFPMFGFAIRARLRIGMFSIARKNAREFFNTIGFPDICSEILANYLSEESLVIFYQE